MPKQIIEIDTDQWAVVPREQLEKLGKARAFMCNTTENYHKEPSLMALSTVIWQTVNKNWNAAAPRPEPVQQSSQHADDIAVDRFAEAMKSKLAKKRGEGRGGWESCPAEVLSKMLIEHIEKGDPVDVANFCMMLHQTGNGIVQPPAQPIPTAERLPTDDDFDCLGKIWCYFGDIGEWQIVHRDDDGNAYMFSDYWLPTGLTRPAEPAVCAECNGSGHASDQSGEACAYCHGTGQ